MLQKSLSYAFKKFQRFYKVPEKIIRYKKIKNYKIWAMNLDSDCFVKNFFWSNTLTLLANISKETGLVPSEMYGLSIGQGLTLSTMENYQVFL